MESKVCPVCKIFSSTSNTTLNAHMDRCLSAENDILLVGNKNPKLNVKPRKKRLMKDIYANAPRCTLEDLDRRNGTSWATDKNLAAPNIEVNAEAKKPKLSQVVERDNHWNDVPVYVDSNGIKLRILSKFNDTTQVVSREEFRTEKSVKVVRDEKRILISKRKYFATKNLKKMKFKLKKEQPRALKVCQNEIQAVQGVAFDEETNQMAERPLVQLSNEQDLIGCYSSVDLQKWCCSKRSDLKKKFSSIDFHEQLEQPKTGSEMVMLERRKPASDAYSAAKRQFSDYSTSMELNTVYHPAKTVRKMYTQKSSKERPVEGTTNVLRLKLSRKSGASVSAIGRRTREDIVMEVRQKSYTSSDIRTASNEKCCLQRINEIISTSSTKKLRKHRSFPGAGKRNREHSSSDCSIGERSAEDAVKGCSEENVHRSLNSETELFQIVERKCSKQMEILADGNSTEAKSISYEGQGLLSDPNDKISLTIPTQEIGMPMKQVFLDEQEKQTSDEIVCGGIESEATSAQESSACLTSHGDLGADIPMENPWIPSASFVSNQGNNLAVRKPCRSPSSSASAISPASPKDSEPLHNPSTTKGNSSLLSTFSGGDELTQGTTSIETHQQFCTDSNSNSNKPHQLPDHKKQFLNLYIRPNNSFGFYPNLQTEPACTPVLESPSGSVLSRAFNDFGSTSPSCGTPTQSSSNSILRLMGKNLMVVNSEEAAQIPKVQSLGTDNNSNKQSLPSNLGFASCAVPKLETHMQSNMNHKAYIAKEVIFIDDSANEDFRQIADMPPIPVQQTVFQMQLPHFQPPSQLLARYNSYVPSYLINQGSSFEYPASLFPSRFVFGPPSESHMNPSLYSQQSLR